MTGMPAQELLMLTTEAATQPITPLELTSIHEWFGNVPITCAGVLGGS